MALVWSTFCAVAALAAAVPQRAVSDAQGNFRTRVLPGIGYIRYEVQPGDDAEEPGELIVVHEEHRADASASTSAASLESAVPAPSRAPARPCASERAKLVARLFEMRGLQIEPEFAAWLERNGALGNINVVNQGWGGEPLLLTAVRSDVAARALAEDVARCEKAQ